MATTRPYNTRAFARNKSYITHDELLNLLEQEFTKQASLPDKLDMRHMLEQHNYYTELRKIDCSDFPEHIINFMNENIKFFDITLNHCVNLPASHYKNCTFVNTFFMDQPYRFHFTHCLIVADTEACKRAFKDAQKNHKRGNLVIATYEQKPVLAVVYTPSFGTYYTDSTAAILKKRGINIVTVYSKNAFTNYGDGVTPEHPLFSHLALLNGILLPGGFDVETDKNRYGNREKLESYMVDLALLHNIPLLGICRGHQFIGHYFGAEVKDVYNHQEDHIRIAPIPDSMLYQLADRKFASQTAKRKREDISKDETGFHYVSACMHSQGIFFGDNPDKRVKITAYADDKLPESLQVNSNIISFQHHHEAKEDYNSFARSVLKEFSKMVKTDNSKTRELLKTARDERSDQLEDTRDSKKARVNPHTARLFARSQEIDTQKAPDSPRDGYSP